MKPRTPAKKYRFMLGTTSRVPDRPGWHYLIIDIDGKKDPIPEGGIAIKQQTSNGLHVYTPLRYRLSKMLHIAKRLGADRTWARLALKRGWAFLADKGEAKIPWPVERMVIGWRKYAIRSESGNSCDTYRVERKTGEQSRVRKRSTCNRN